MSALRWLCSVAGPLVTAVFAGAVACSAPLDTKTKAVEATAARAAVDACAGSPPPARAYEGPLRHAKCEQDMFLTMAGIAEDLDVSCAYCHSQKADGKGFEYAAMTKKKEVALWMDQTFVRALKRADGKPMLCSSCHINKHGKPAAKFLGEPRDLSFTVEWMTTVMTNRFVLANGEKLKCKHCHGATWGSKDFISQVIGRTQQVPHLEPSPTSPSDPVEAPKPLSAPTEPPPNSTKPLKSP